MSAPTSAEVRLPQRRAKRRLYQALVAMIAKIRQPPGARRFSTTALLCSAMMIFSAHNAAAQQKPALPNGASSLQETYADWRLTCGVQNNVPTCTLMQDQLQKDGQRLLTMQVSMQGDGAAATLLLPFGILFESGVVPQIDDQPPMPALHFRTCLPSGCIALFPLDAHALQKLRTGSSLRLKVRTAAETDIAFSISLNGLTAALNRLATLESH